MSLPSTSGMASSSASSYPRLQAEMSMPSTSSSGSSSPSSRLRAEMSMPSTSGTDTCPSSSSSLKMSRKRPREITEAERLICEFEQYQLEKLEKASRSYKASLRVAEKFDVTGSSQTAESSQTAVSSQTPCSSQTLGSSETRGSSETTVSSEQLGNTGQSTFGTEEEQVQATSTPVQSTLGVKRKRSYLLSAKFIDDSLEVILACTLDASAKIYSHRVDIVRKEVMKLADMLAPYCISKRSDSGNDDSKSKDDVSSDRKKKATICGNPEVIISKRNGKNPLTKFVKVGAHAGNLMESMLKTGKTLSTDIRYKPSPKKEVSRRGKVIPFKVKYFKI